MINLKEYIGESLLDDFDTINDKVSNITKHPFGYFWSTVVKSGNWEGSVKDLEKNLAWSAEPGDSSMKDLPKGQVLVVFYKSGASDLTKIYIRYSKQDWTVMKKYFASQTGRTGAWANVPQLHIVPFLKKHDRPHISFGSIRPYKKEGYLLSKEYSADAIDMINKFAHSEWATYWTNL